MLRAPEEAEMSAASTRSRVLPTLALVLAAVGLAAASVGADEIAALGPGGHIYVGADYYPEHWPEERWAEDARLMKEAGFDVVRLAEFAWVLMEPEEGRFEFEWLDHAIETLAARDVKVILGTPTAVMPAWVARKYPETLAMKADGTRVVWGGRKNNCFSNGTYRLLSERITRAMAEHYRDNPNVIGWQTDNEFGGTDCRCHRCRASFQDWLRRKYGSLDELNRAWGTHFWGLKVQTWGEITIPDSREGEWAISNASASLDWMRYTSWLNVEFQADQVRIIRELCPSRQFVTHNFMGLFQNMDYYELAKDLDFVSWDNYPVFADWEKPGVSYRASFAADVMRGLKQKNFWIMEESAGPLGWGIFSRNPRPGEIRMIAYQQLAHGADAQMWFRWRTCTAGREQYWHGLLGHDGKPGRRYREAAQVASEYRKLEAVLAGTTVRSDVAIIYDYDSIWALRLQPGFAGNSFQEAVGRYQRALFRSGVNVDMVRPGSDLSGYKLVLAPSLHVLPDDLARQLVAYVEGGGVLLADARTAVKDETNLAHARTLPGLLSPALGIEIPEYESLGAVEYPVEGKPPLDGSFTAIRYADWTTPTGADVIAGYGVWPVEEFAAVTRHAHGKGFGWYVGTIMKEEAFYDRLVAALMEDAGFTAVLDPPDGVEVSVRQGEGRRVLFVINHTEEARTVSVPAGKQELLSGEVTEGTLELGAYGVAVIKL
jgi:beta-galactosidase